MGDKLQTIKIVYIFCIFIISCFGLIPVIFKKVRAFPNAISIMNCFAGGVFLAMALVHILPEAVEQYEAAMTGKPSGHSHRLLQDADGHEEDEHDDHDHEEEEVAAETEEEGELFPLPYLLFFLGYVIVLFIDRVVFKHAHGHDHGEDEHEHKHGHEHKCRPETEMQHLHHHHHIQVDNKGDEIKAITVECHEHKPFEVCPAELI